MATDLQRGQRTSREMAEVSLTIPARAEYVVLCRLALAGIARVRELDDDAVADLKLALTEACTNSIRHAYPEGSGAVEVRYELSGHTLTVEVADEGPGFEPPKRADDGGDLDEGGLGIAIIRALMDEVEIESTARAGSRLRFSKHLS